MMKSAWWGLAGLILLAGCSGYGPPDNLGSLTADQIVARMGPPDVQRRSAEGTRLEFPRGPAGRHTWFVYVDPQGRAVRAEQVLTVANFTQINPGMAEGEVLERLGRPGVVEGLARARGKVWSYRYENSQCLWFQIELTQERTVRSAGYGEPPECRQRDPRVLF